MRAEGRGISAPFAVAGFGLLFAIAVLAIGGYYRSKGAVPLAFLVGGTLMIGGLAVGMMRELLGRGSSR